MSQLEHLMSLGASPVGPDVVWKGQVVAHVLADGQLMLTPEGEEAMLITDVAVKEVEPASQVGLVAAPLAKKAGRKKAAAAETPVEPEVTGEDFSFTSGDE